MYSFMNDYSEGAHPRILRALSEANPRQFSGYGMDGVCQEAAELIRARCTAPEAAVHFVTGGTQANLLVIHALLRSYEAVIAADTAHVSVHETGAIEATGHKVCAVPSPDGKLTPAMVEQAVQSHSSEHMVYPRLVYISNTTEAGTVYTRAELAALRRCCNENGLYLFLDGARLGSALTAPGSDLTLTDIAALTDAFYIGGTKNGALFGEAIVLLQDGAKPHFRWYIKQRGAMLAKGWLLGLQFRELLRDDLYFDLARHANEMAQLLSAGISEKGYSFAVPPQSNQLFPVLPNPVIRQLRDAGCQFDAEGTADGQRTRIRLVTSWATPQAAVEEFLRVLPEAK